MSETETVNENETKKSGSDETGVEKAYYSPADMENANTMMAYIEANIPAKQIVRNFTVADDGSFEVPEGFGLHIVPLSKRVANENRVIGVALAVAPDFENVLLETNDAGETELRDVGLSLFRDLWQDTCAAKIANAVRPRGEGSIKLGEASNMPRTFEHFIEGRRRGENVQSYTLLQRPIVAALKDKGFAIMSSGILRRALSSAAFAKEQFPEVEQDQWVLILSLFEKRADAYKEKVKDNASGTVTEVAKPLDKTIFAKWRNTRNEVVESQEVNADFSDLMQME